MSRYHIRSYAYTNQAGVRSGLSAIGADAAGLQRMLEKSAFFCLGGSGISAPAALILKQEALARGAEAVIHRDVLVGRIDRSRFALLGTERQLREICQKLRVQAFGLPALAAELEEALADYPQLKVSFGSSQAVLTGEANDRSGQTAAWLAEHAWRVYVAVPAGDESAYEQTLRAAGLPAGRLVPVTEAPAGAGENWAVLTRTPTE